MEFIELFEMQRQLDRFIEETQISKRMYLMKKAWHY